jgi:predicted PurR-regulated permease PerM
VSRKIIIVIILLLMVASLVILKPSFPHLFQYFFTSSENLKNEKINGLHLFDNVNDKKFEKMYGKQTLKSQNNDLYNYYKIQDGLEIATNDNGDILRFIIETGIPTAKGIGVGDLLIKQRLYTEKIIINV